MSTPTEALTLVLQQSGLSKIDIFNCKFVNKEWNSISKAIFCNCITINENINSTKFINCLIIYSFKNLLFGITINSCHRTPPLSPKDMRVILFYCNNSEIIHLDFIDPFLLLPEIESVQLPNLKMIDISWSRLSEPSDKLRKRFLTANNKHKDSIEFVNMSPTNNTNQINGKINNKDLTFREKEFKGKFSKLKYSHRYGAL